MATVGEKDEARSISANGSSNNRVVPVYDPRTESLRAAPASEASKLAGFGYKIGAEAELEAEKNSTPAKIGAFLTKAGNIGSAGLLNLGLAAAGRRGDLINAQEAQEANPWSSGAGTAAGIAGSILSGSWQLGASSLGLKGLSGVIAKQATTGGAAALMQGVSDQIKEDTILKHPLSVTALGMSAFTDVMWNAGLNVLTHGIIRSPAALRSAVGNIADRAEAMGVIKRNMVKAPAVAETGPTLKGFTTKVESGFKDVNESTVSGKASAAAENSERVQTDDFNRAQSKVDESGSSDVLKKTATSSKTTKPLTAAENLENNLAKEEPLDLETVKKQKIPFIWDGHTPKQKMSVLRDAIDELVAKDPVHKQMWDKIPVLEEQYKKMLKKDGEEALNILREKEEYKAFLSEELPQTLQDGLPVPGFAELNDEYARAAGNPYKDLKKFKFGIKVPDPKGKVPRPRPGSISQAESTVDQLREKTGFKTSEASDASSRLKTDTFEETASKVEGGFSVGSKTEASGKVSHSFRYTMPKAPKEFIKGDLKIPFQGVPENLITGGALTGTGTYAYPLAGAAKAAQLSVKLLNHRDQIGPVFEKVATGIFKTVTPVIQYGTRVTRQQNRTQSLDLNTKFYNPAVQTVNAVVSNPDAVQGVLQRKYPALNEQHPEVIAQMTAQIIKGAQALDAIAQKKPFDPTLQDTAYTPTRSQQVKFLRAWRMLANPTEAIHYGDPQMAKMVQDVYPDFANHARETIQNEMSVQKKPMTGPTARQISAFMGANVRPMNDPKALKRLQETAGPMPQKQGGAGLGKPAKSNKISQEAAMRESTPLQQKQLGI